MRDAAGLTQDEVAAAAGMSVAQYRRIEHDDLQTTPTIGKLAAIANVLEVPLVSILEPRWLAGAEVCPKPGARRKA